MRQFEIANLSQMFDQTETSSFLCESFIRRATSRGSDVRLDTGRLMRPEIWPRMGVRANLWSWKIVLSYLWKDSSHITELELRAVLSALRWRLRSSKYLKCRFLHLSDSQAGLGVLTKCRSSSYKLQRVMYPICALLLFSHCLPAWAYVDTHTNPADLPSRRLLKVRKKRKPCRRVEPG